MKKLFFICWLVTLNLQAVQPPIGGVFEMAWTKVSASPVVDWCIWESTNQGVKWKQIGTTRVPTFKWTNANINPVNTRYAITEMNWEPSGSQNPRLETEMVLLHWAPSPTAPATNAANYVKMIGGYIPPNTWVKISSNLHNFTDHLRLKTFNVSNDTYTEITNTVIYVDYSTANQGGRVFFHIPVITNPPTPGQQFSKPK